MHKFWKLIDAMTVRKDTKKRVIKDTNNDERVEKWYENFKFSHNRSIP